MVAALGGFKPAGGGIFATPAAANQPFGAGGAAATQPQDPTMLATTAPGPEDLQSKTGNCLQRTVEAEVQAVFDDLRQLVAEEDMKK